MSRTATLRNLILKAKHAYYYSGEPVMSDAEYDALEDELRLLDPSDPVLGLVWSPVPPDTMLTKARHSLPMGSQSKVNSEEEFRSWCPKNEVQAIHASLKGDGASAAAYYRDGRMVQAISRGDGTVGEDITANAMRFKGLPAWVGTQDVGFSGAVRFEVILTVEDWTRIDPTRSKNPRNAGTGIMGRKNGNQSDCLTIFAFDLDETIDGQSVDFPTEAQKTLRLAELGFNPISYAIYDNADDVVEYFRNIAAKADLNVKNDQQDTPLMGAVESGSISIVRMLIDAGANADDKDFDGNTALRRAISSDKHIFDIIEYLINSSGNVNLQDDSGGSCLSKAVMTGRNELVQPLIAAGADVNLKDEEDRSALAYAVKSEKLSLETIKALVDAGAVVDNIDVEGETALFAAFARDNKDLTRAQERRSTLANQKIRAEAATPDLNNRWVKAQAALDNWQLDLQRNLALAHLPLDANIGAIEGALALFERMHQQLEKIRDIRVNRIDMMRHDLNEFAATAKSLATDIAPEIAQQPAAQIAIALDKRWKQELSASQDLGRLTTELENATAQANAANRRIVEAKASLEPLLRLFGATDNEGLRCATERSDRLRSVTSEIDQTVKQLLQAGDGLDRQALEAAFKAIDVNTISIRLPEIKLQTDEMVAQQNRLSGELNAAEAALGKIAGQDEAARAESQRQEALARMSNAVERYIKVYTAAKLLRWSIERFRESKQGPMLARASAVFEGLTQGGFNRLVVDYESDPLKRSGQRASAELVDIEGMSEGTRDQLYLALRLAALELHLEQTVPLPFIADDLFINYDDGRAKAGLEALAKLSEMTQVIFLSHHAHLVPLAQSVFGDRLNVVNLG